MPLASLSAGTITETEGGGPSLLPVHPSELLLLLPLLLLVEAGLASCSPAGWPRADSTATAAPLACMRGQNTSGAHLLGPVLGGGCKGTR